MALTVSKRDRLQRGVVIPAHPLALRADRTLDRRRQAALTRYYLASGAGGVAVGVHSTQFEIREHGLYEEVLGIAMETSREFADADPIMIAGVIGPTEQALREAEIAVGLRYDIALVGLGGLGEWSEDALVDHMATIAEVIPVCGFYLQPSVGGHMLGYAFWKRIAAIEGVVAIKIAPFDRYFTQDVVRAVVESPRRDEIALYTGNDDNIVADLLTTFAFEVDGERREKRIVGGLLGHWGVWTSRAVELLERCHAAVESGDGRAYAELLTEGVRVTDMNAAIFDPHHRFAGCVPGIHEVLRRQGLLEGTWCLNPDERMSDGQSEEIDRVVAAYPELTDDAFVKAHVEEWLGVG